MATSALRSPLAPALLSSWSAAAKGKARASSAFSTLSTPALALSSLPRSSPSPALSSSSSLSPTASRRITTSSVPVTDPIPPPPPTGFLSPTSPPPPQSITSTSAALALLKKQPSHYIITSIVGRTLLLTTRDVFTISRLRDVQVGDVLELERIHEVGSRDYTLRAQDSMSTRRRGAAAQNRRSVDDHPPSAEALRALLHLPDGQGQDRDGALLPAEGQQDGDAASDSTAADGASTQAALQALGLVSLPKMSTTSWATRLHPSGLAHVGSVLPPTTVRARCVVVEHTKGAMEWIVKKKRRKGYQKTIRHKQTYTRLRLESIKLGNGELDG